MGHIVQPLATAFHAHFLQTTAAESSICRAQAHVQDIHRAVPDVNWKVAHTYTRSCMQWCLLNVQADARVDWHAGCIAQYFLSEKKAAQQMPAPPV